jgi:hypothetical protein
MIKPLIFTFILLPFLSIGQAFTFLKQQTIIDTIHELKADTFQFKINDVTILIKDEGTSILKIIKNKIVDSAEIDFGSWFHIYNMGYLLKNKRIYFLFFIKENGDNYAALYSFNEKKLKDTKCFHLDSDVLNGDTLTLKFSNRTYNINLKNDLKKKDRNADFEYN